MSAFDVKTKVGDLTVIGSGVAHLHGTNEISIDINGYVCLVRFVTDGSGPRYEGGPIGTGFVVTCYNHLNSFGESIFTPFAIGLADDKPLYMTYYTSLIEPTAGVRRFEYCLWMKA